MAKIFGNEATQRHFIDSFQKYPVSVVIGPSHIGKKTFVHSHLETLANDDDIMVVGSSIDDARQAQSFADSRPMFGSSKFLLIDDAHNLTEPAQDAYLKLFEESDNFLRIVLVTEDHGLLVPALRSRIVMDYHFGCLSHESMGAFIDADSMSPDMDASRLCDGRPGLYHLISSSPSLKSFAGEVEKTLSGQLDPVLSPVPEVLKDLKEIEKRDAVSVICRRALFNALDNPSSRARARGLSNFCSIIKRYPSANAEIYWSRFVLGVH